MTASSRVNNFGSDEPMRLVSSGVNNFGSNESIPGSQSDWLLPGSIILEVMRLASSWVNNFVSDEPMRLASSRVNIISDSSGNEIKPATDKISIVNIPDQHQYV